MIESDGKRLKRYRRAAVNRQSTSLRDSQSPDWNTVRSGCLFDRRFQCGFDGHNDRGCRFTKPLHINAVTNFRQGDIGAHPGKDRHFGQRDRQTTQRDIVCGLHDLLFDEEADYQLQ